MNLLVAGYVLCEDKSSYSWKKIVLKGLPTVFWVLDDCYDMSEYLQKQYYDRGSAHLDGWYETP